MFENWPIHFEPAVRREVTPPLAVIVDLAAGVARTPEAISAELPLRVRAEGLVLDAKVPARLYFWARTNRGDWLGRCRCRIPAGRDGWIDTEQWFPSAAITPST